MIGRDISCLALSVSHHRNIKLNSVAKFILGIQEALGFVTRDMILKTLTEIFLLL